MQKHLDFMRLTADNQFFFNIGIQICAICEKPPYTNNLAPLDKDKPAQQGNISRASYSYTPFGDYTPALWQHRSAAHSPSPTSGIAPYIAEEGLAHPHLSRWQLLDAIKENAHQALLLGNTI